MPWRDWQFWLVSALAIWGLWVLARPFIPRRKSAGDDEPACPNCASGSSASKKKTARRVALTVDRRRI